MTPGARKMRIGGLGKSDTEVGFGWVSGDVDILVAI